MLTSLPRELQYEILVHLPHKDRLSLFFTCRTLSHLVKPSIFPVLYFHNYGRYSSCTKNVDIVHLETRVQDVIEIAPFVKTFHFGPGRCVDDFWKKYREWVVARADEDIDEDSASWDGVAEERDPDTGYPVGSYEERAEKRVEKIRARRQSRLDRERALIERNEELWAERLERQSAKQPSGDAALTRLFTEMHKLNRIEFGISHLDIETLGFNDEDDRMSHEVYDQFSETAQIWMNIKTVALALQAANRHVKEMVIPELDPQIIEEAPGIHHAFTGLINLDIEFTSPKSFDINASFSPTLPALFKCTLPTLKKLTIRLGDYWKRELSEYGIDFLCEPQSIPDQNHTPLPLVFQQLEELEFMSMVISAKSLITFLSAQVSLKHIGFYSTRLATPGYSWADVAANMPQSLESWYVSDCEHRPYPDASTSPSYAWMPLFLPYREVLPVSTGWIAQEPEDRLLELSEVYDKEELRAASFVRVGTNLAAD